MYLKWFSMQCVISDALHHICFALQLLKIRAYFINNGEIEEHKCFDVSLAVTMDKLRMDIHICIAYEDNNTSNVNRTLCTRLTHFKSHWISQDAAFLFSSHYVRMLLKVYMDVVFALHVKLKNIHVSFLNILFSKESTLIIYSFPLYYRNICRICRVRHMMVGSAHVHISLGQIWNK